MLEYPLYQESYGKVWKVADIFVMQIAQAVLEVNVLP